MMRQNSGRASIQNVLVNGDDEDGTVLLEQALELVEVDSLVLRFAPHIVLVLATGCFRANCVC